VVERSLAVAMGVDLPHPLELRMGEYRVGLERPIPTYKIVNRGVQAAIRGPCEGRRHRYLVAQAAILAQLVAAGAIDHDVGVGDHPRPRHPEGTENPLRE